MTQWHGDTVTRDVTNQEEEEEGAGMYRTVSKHLSYVIQWRTHATQLLAQSTYNRCYTGICHNNQTYIFVTLISIMHRVPGSFEVTEHVMLRIVK